MKRFETIIIGGGMAGIGCAQKLKKHKQDFLLITDQLFDRLMTSDDGLINYGAYYVRKDYKHILPYVKTTRKLDFLSTFFYDHGKEYNLLDPRFYKDYPEAVLLVAHLLKFKEHFYVFRKRCEVISQPQALREDPYLYELYYTKALDFLKSDFLLDFYKDYMRRIIRATGFISLHKVNAMNLLLIGLPLVTPTYEFIFNKKKILKDIQKSIVFDAVLRISKSGGGYLLKTKKTTYFAKQVVVATPPSVSRKLLKIPSMRKPINVMMYHVSGVLKKTLHHDLDIFAPRKEEIVLARQIDGTYLFYAKRNSLKKYFSSYRIIKYHHWNPAFHLEGTELWESKMDEGLYLIGDHNFFGLEDTYISGIYAANQIIASHKHNS